MDFSKNSNLRSLIPAVLVGLLALAANEYTRIDPKVLRTAVQSVEQKIVEIGQKDDKERPDPEEEFQRLRKFDTIVTARFSKWKKHRHEVNRKQLEAIVEKSDAICQDINGHPDAKKPLQERVLLTQLSILFKAAQMRPDVFTEHFEEVSYKAQVGHSDVLRFYHKVNFTDPDDKKLLSDLKGFSDNHPAAMGIRLYSFVADELISRGHRDLARQVLQQGVRTYSGVPGAARLINQLIDEGSPHFQTIPVPKRTGMSGRRISGISIPSKPHVRGRGGHRRAPAPPRSAGSRRGTRRTRQ